MRRDELPVAVVTGASRGIGQCIAENLVKKGCRVVYAARSFARSNTGLTEHTTTDLAAYIPCDISSPEDRSRLLDETISRFGRVDLLVNNAGIAPSVRRDVLETTIESFEQLMRINLEGTFFMCQLFAKRMVEQASAGYKPGRIVNIASISSYTSSVTRGEYCISKAGISMVTRLFADRLAEYGIGVFEIRPGIIRTDMTAGVQAQYEKRIAEGLTPIKRMGTPQDVADAVLSVHEGSFDFCTGQVFNVDGGFHIRRL